MDPSTLMAAGTLYVAALVARTAADDLASDLWAKIKVALAAKLGREPESKDVTAKALEDVTQDAGIHQRLATLLGESSTLRRAQVVEKAIRGARILWVDDRPEGNVWEHDCLTTLGAVIKTVETTRSAVACLESESFDLLISDVDREGRDRAGLDDLAELEASAPGLPVVFYVMDRKPGVPAGAFGITAHPDELLHLCMDALERTRL
jgi:CheY-like chemotaxis protein